MNNTTYNNGLIDIRDVNIDLEQPFSQRQAEFVKQIKTPNCFMYKDFTVNIKYKSEELIEDKIVEYITRKMNAKKHV